MGSPPEAPSQPPWRLGGLGSEGQGPRLRLLALLNRECAWIYDIRRLTGLSSSSTELAFELYRYLVAGQDVHDGAWRDFVIKYGFVKPEQLDSFVTSFNERKARSIETVAKACREILRSPLTMVSELATELPPTLAAKTVAEALEEKLDKELALQLAGVVDYTRLYDILVQEITMLAMEELGMDEQAVNDMLACLYEC